MKIVYRKKEAKKSWWWKVGNGNMARLKKKDKQEDGVCNESTVILENNKEWIHLWGERRAAEAKSRV